MTGGKLFVLLVYVVIALAYVFSRGTPYAGWIDWFIIAAIIVHALEVVFFFPLARRAKGSTLWHSTNVFIFGVFHPKAMIENAD